MACILLFLPRGVTTGLHLDARAPGEGTQWATLRRDAGLNGEPIEKRRKRNVRKLLFLACCAVLAYGLFRPEPPPDLFDESDKFLHLIAFGGLSLVTRIAFPSTPGWLLWPLLYIQAPLLEWLQHVIQPVREFSPLDVLANLCGISLALVLWICQGLLRKRLFKPA